MKKKKCLSCLNLEIEFEEKTLGTIRQAHSGRTSHVAVSKHHSCSHHFFTIIQKEEHHRSLICSRAFDNFYFPLRRLRRCISHFGLFSPLRID